MGVSRENGWLDKLVSFCKPPGPPLQALGGGDGGEGCCAERTPVAELRF